MKLWKCTYCNHQLYSEQLPQHCPYCQMNEAFMEEAEQQCDEVYLNSDARIVIIGGGVAALSAARQIRDLDKGCRIDMFCKETYAPYNRKDLSRHLFALQQKNFSLVDEDWYEQHHIYLHKDCEIVEINTKGNHVRSVYGGCYPYDSLILAMGGNIVIPDIEGQDLEKVYALRTMEDATHIMSDAKAGRHALIYGGGLSGIELACTLASIHMKVDLVDPLPALLAPYVDNIAAQMLEDYLTSLGIRVHTNQSIHAMHGISRVESVEMTNGKCINTNFVVYTQSMHPAIRLCEESGIACKHGVITNAFMQTNIPNIYACGDVCNHHDHAHEHYENARLQGICAAYNIVGKPCIYQEVRMPFVFKHEDFTLFSYGDIHQMDQYRIAHDEQHNTYEKFIYQDGSCSGALLVNRYEHIAQVQKAVDQHVRFPHEKSA